MIIRNKGSDGCGVEMIVMLIVTAATIAATTAVASAVATVFLVLPSLHIVDRDPDRDDIDLAVALDFSDPSLLLIQFDSIQFMRILINGGDHDDDDDVDDMLIV